MRRALPGLLLAILLLKPAAAQQKTLTLDDIYGPGAYALYSGEPAGFVTWPEHPWVDDAHYLRPDDSAATHWLKVDAVSGTSEPLVDRARLAAALAKLPRVSSRDATSAAGPRPTKFNQRHDGFLVRIGADLFYYDIVRDNATRLTESADLKEEATISPDGKSVAFISRNNLFVTSVAKPAVRALTKDGNPDLMNGKLDWVYSEELYGRGNHNAYWWSPDSSRIAFIRLDETGVPTYTVMDDIPYHPRLETWKYPKAGDPNPIAKLGVATVAGGSLRWIDTAKYDDFLLVDVGWSPDSRSVAYQIQDRAQTWLDLNLADAATGNAATLFRESGQPWVERWRDSSADPVWLKDGSFLWLSERTGWRHLYAYTPGGVLIKQLTAGEWEVRAIKAVDAAGGWIYFAGTERSIRDSDVYRVKLDGTGLQRITAESGAHETLFNPAASLYLDSWSDATHPNRMTLHRPNGSEVRVVDANPVPALNEYKLATPEFLQVKARDGFVMEAMMIRPPDFDPSKRYPVYQFVYGGPHLQEVLNVWNGSEYLYEQLLAARGTIVWRCDNRTASGKGAVSAQRAYGNLGEVELGDIEDCMSWLKQQPYVDATRIGIAGDSYGGYLTIFALTHPSSFTMGVACCAVTDWSDYDTIFTERYMGLPRNNPEAYRKSSPRFNAAGLHGQLLLTHGELDDNVHLQNVMQFAYALQAAGKQFQMMIYPTSGHGVTDPELYRHERQLMLDFTLKQLNLGR